jgi:hypothetical protein
MLQSACRKDHSSKLRRQAGLTAPEDFRNLVAPTIGFFIASGASIQLSGLLCYLVNRISITCCLPCSVLYMSPPGLYVTAGCQPAEFRAGPVSRLAKGDLACVPYARVLWAWTYLSISSWTSSLSLDTRNEPFHIDGSFFSSGNSDRNTAAVATLNR